MQSSSFPLCSYLLFVSAVLLGALLLVAQYLEPQSQDPGFGIAPAHASHVRPDEPDEVAIIHKLRALPLN
jgi:hypothetical protein